MMVITNLIWNVSEMISYSICCLELLLTFNLNYIEIQGYAKFLGMDLEADKEFLFIAEEGLKAPVPEPW